MQSSHKIRFVYFGGGTPSVLSAAQIDTILSCILNNFSLADQIEVSLETHPTHATIAKLRDFNAAGISRLSLGVQSFSANSLISLGASHESSDSFNAVKNAHSIFEDYAVDLIYNHLGQTLTEWQSDVRSAINFDVPHLSCYALVPISAQNSSSTLHEIELATLALSTLDDAGYSHYASCSSGGFDVSLPGQNCQYELMHWKAPQAHFIGMGPGAFGFIGGYCTVNGYGLDFYSEKLKSNCLPIVSAKQVSDTELRHRYFVLGVKCLEVSLSGYRNQFGRDPLSDFKSEIETLIEMDLAILADDCLMLNQKGRLFVDTCSSVFFSNTQRFIEHPEEPHVRHLMGELQHAIAQNR
jgi:oxygen-independent coproporphyrinogen-3 oxidase